MFESEFVSGFSELKNILIRTYEIEKPKVQIKLHFTVLDNELRMHDYDDHSKVVNLSDDILGKQVIEFPERQAVEIIKMALEQGDPLDYLRDGFLLYGFFRP